jgi:Protein of unknown function (DUF4230)
MGAMTPQPPPEPQPARQGVPGWLVGVGIAAVGLYLLVGWVGGLLPDFGNPFSERTVDRSGPALLKSLQDLEEYHAATGHFEAIVDVERDTRFVPSAIRGERVLFVAVGSVDAGVGFGGLGADSVEVSEDRTSVVLELPPARFYEPRLDLDRSYVYDRDRGALDRIGDLLGDDTGDDRELYRLAEEKLAAAARDGSGLLALAEENTHAMLTALLTSLGFTDVEIRFAGV